MRLIDADLLVLSDMEIVMCNGDYKEALKMLIDKIEQAPSIEPQCETGRWIRDCIDYDFCPRCGTRMYIRKDGDLNGSV